jgi:hypothetical protein
VIGVFWKSESSPIKWHQCGLLTRHLYSLFYQMQIISKACVVIVYGRAVKSNRNRIVFHYRIEFFWPNRIESYPDQIESIFRFSIRFDSIGTESWTRKTCNVRVESENFTK